MRNRNHFRFRIALVIGDALAILLAYIFAYIVRVKLSGRGVETFVFARDYLVYLLLLLPFILILFSLIGTYSAANQKKISQFLRLFAGSFGAVLFVVAIDYFSPTVIFPAKLVLIYGFIFSIILLILNRAILLLIRRILCKNQKNITKILLIGDNAIAEQIIAEINQNPEYKIATVVGDRRKSFVTHANFLDAKKHSRPDLIIQVETEKNPSLDREALNFSRKNYIPFQFVPCEINDLPEKINFELFLGAIPMMSLVPTPLAGSGRVAKRAFDIIFSLIGIIIFSPIMLLIFLILLFKGGKPIYQRKRMTRWGKYFMIYKFRSLKPEFSGLDPEAGFHKMGRPELIKKFRANGDYLENDPRIDRFGKFIRATSLDELPQLFNVLRGEISLVGPRALIEEELSESKHKDTILNVKSGLTGLAVVSGRKNLPFEQRRNLDAYYVRNWSLALDIKIIFKTIWLVISGRGAK